MLRNLRLAIALLSASLSVPGMGQTFSPPDAHTGTRPIGAATQQAPRYIPGGFDLPNGWRISPGRRRKIPTAEKETSFARLGRTNAPVPARAHKAKAASSRWRLNADC